MQRSTWKARSLVIGLATRTFRVLSARNNTSQAVVFNPVFDPPRNHPLRVVSVFAPNLRKLLPKHFEKSLGEKTLLFVSS